MFRVLKSAIRHLQPSPAMPLSLVGSGGIEPLANHHTYAWEATGLQPVVWITSLVPMVGLEPTRFLRHPGLSRTCLPNSTTSACGNRIRYSRTLYSLQAITLERRPNCRLFPMANEACCYTKVFGTTTFAGKNDGDFVCHHPTLSHAISAQVSRAVPVVVLVPEQVSCPAKTTYCDLLLPRSHTH